MTGTAQADGDQKRSGRQPEGPRVFAFAAQAEAKRSPAERRAPRSRVTCPSRVPLRMREPAIR